MKRTHLLLSALLACLASQGADSFFRKAVAVFLGFTMLAACQHRPSHYDAEDEEDEELVMLSDWADSYLVDTLGNSILGTALPLNSWWTDGNIYYQVKQTGKTILLDGRTLHKDGFQLTLQAEQDELRVGKPRFKGENLSAESDCLVRWHRIDRDAGGDEIEPAIELLVAYAKDNNQEPVAVLQRFDGDELQFELDGVHALLEGIYKGEDGTVWTFLPDGTMTMKEGEQPQAYTIERSYHALTNIVCLPDGRRVALKLSNDGQLHVLQACFDDSEKEWQQAEPRQEMMRLTKKEDESWYFDTPFWGNQRMFTLSMRRFIEGQVCDLLNQYRDLSYSRFPFGQLNARILYQMSVLEAQAE